MKVRAEFKRRLEENEVSDRHSESLNETLKRLEARFGDQVVSEIKAEEVREWLTGLPLATKTRNKHRGYAGQVFNLAVDHGYLPANPVTKIKRFNERSTEDDEISILSADETERLLRAADPVVIPFLTLSFFCGVRVATLERLSWADVKFEERRVIVPRYKGKNQKRYPVTLSENAREWLKPYVRKSGSLLVPATSINRPGAIFGSPSRTATRKLILARRNAQESPYQITQGDIPSFQCTSPLTSRWIKRQPDRITPRLLLRAIIWVLLPGQMPQSTGRFAPNLWLKDEIRKRVARITLTFNADVLGDVADILGDATRPGKYMVVTVTFVNGASQLAFIKGDRAVLLYPRCRRADEHRHQGKAKTDYRPGN